MYPLKFEPILKQTLWGGDKIIPFKHLNESLQNVGESWEVSAVEGSESVVANGPDKGLTLPEMVRKYKEELVGEANYARFGEKFPLLIKFIDAKLDLSIQVHPDDALAKQRHNSFGKNEMWYVIAADKGAKLISGFAKEITPKEDTFAEDEYKYNDKIAEEKLPPAGANVDYPSVNELEKQIFKQEFKNQDLNSRLAKLEKEALGQTFENDAFSSRVERLQAKIKPSSLMENKIAEDEGSIPLDKDYSLSGYEPPEFDYDAYNTRNKKPEKVNLASVEKSILRQSFNNDDINNRLARLESTMFGTTFDSDTQEDRLRRISSAYKAQKTASRYDSNKFSQNMATAMQIGTILLMILACVL